MTETIQIVDATKLAASLAAPLSPQLSQVVDWANALVTDEWLYPEDPIPKRVEMIAYGVASRALTNPQGLESRTLSHDETSRTDRYPAEMRKAGVYLTDDELQRLQRSPASQRRRRRHFRTIRTSPGY